MRNEFQLFRLLRFIIIKYIDYVHVYVHILNSKFIVEKNSRFRSLLIVGGICLTKTGEICLLEGSTNPWRISTWCFSPFFWKICRWFSLASMCLDTEFDSTELGHASTIKQDRYSLVMCWRHIRISRHCRSSRAFNYFMFQEGWGKFNLPNFIYISVVE